MAGNSSATISTSANEMGTAVIMAKLKRRRKRNMVTGCLPGSVGQGKTPISGGVHLHTATEVALEDAKVVNHRIIRWEPVVRGQSEATTPIAALSNGRLISLRAAQILEANGVP